MRRGPPYAALAAAILVWGFVFIPLKLLTNPAYTAHPVSAEGFLALRFLPLLPVLLFLLAVNLKRERLPLFIRDWPWIAVMGLLVIPFYHLPLNFAVRSPLHTGLISLMLNLNPALTYFFAVALGQERARKERTIGVALAFAGLTFIFAEEVLLDRRGGAPVVFSWAGAGWMLVSVCSWVGYTLIGRRLAMDHDPKVIFAATGTIGTLAVAAITPALVPIGTVVREALALGPLEWASWAYMSVLSSFLAYWVWIIALRHFEASRLASFGNLIPLVVHAAAALFLPAERKAFTAVYLAGAAVTLAGTTLVIRPRRAPPRPVEEEAPDEATAGPPAPAGGRGVDPTSGR